MAARIVPTGAITAKRAARPTPSSCSHCAAAAMALRLTCRRVLSQSDTPPRTSESSSSVARGAPAKGKVVAQHQGGATTGRCGFSHTAQEFRGAGRRPVAQPPLEVDPRRVSQGMRWGSLAPRRSTVRSTPGICDGNRLIVAALAGPLTSDRRAASNPIPTIGSTGRGNTRNSCSPERAAGPQERQDNARLWFANVKSTWPRIVRQPDS